jgi:hypothetical protein
VTTLGAVWAGVKVITKIDYTFTTPGGTALNAKDELEKEIGQ